MNLIQDMSPGKSLPHGLKWDHPPRAWDPLPGGGLQVSVPPKVDYLQDPTGVNTKDSAPYLWLNVTGDFVAQAHVRPVFTTTWDAGAIMVRHDAQHWAKLCYESTDLGPTAAVSVVTQDTSDDANGVELSPPDLHLQILRVGDMFVMHYSLDGRGWRMVRLFRLPLPPQVRVGLVAQSPAGPGTTVDFLGFSVELRTAANPRTGV